MPAILPHIHILLADDDPDDNLLFHEVMDELPFIAEINVVKNGEQLIEYVQHADNELPDILFLDLNMPRKNGFDCLIEIKKDERLKRLPVIIITTSSDRDIIKQLHANGASYFIRKSNTFEDLKELISTAITATQAGNLQPSIDKFVLRAQSPVNAHK